MPRNIVKVIFNNGCSSLAYDETTTIQDLIRALIKGKLCQNDLRYKKCYMIRGAKYNDDETQLSDVIWFKNSDKIDYIMSEIFLNDDKWKLQLRIRILPTDFNEVNFKDHVSFVYFYEQVKNDFMQLRAHLVHDATQLQCILELGCLEMRRSFQNMKPNVLDKKINFEYLEKDVGLKRFFPENLLNLKYKTIKKLIIKGIKDNENQNEEDCMLIYLEKLKSVWNYYEEVYVCDQETKHVRLVVCFTDGIKIYEQESTMKQQILFKTILKIECSNTLCLIHLINNSFLRFKFIDTHKACNFALLIDAYCMLQSNLDTHLWQELNDQQLPQQKNSKHNSLDNVNEPFSVNAQSSLIDASFEIQRKSIELIEKIGSGQFGDVFKGLFKKSNENQMEVAIKMLKLNELNEGEDQEIVKNKFMQEAKIMHNFEHPHIIKLIGICSDYPCFIIMEMAKFGQLRKYLQLNVNKIEISILIFYCYQLNTAMSYLESKNFVHRDIAARNILVSSPTCVKLSDFGLSREIEENFYLASKSKLPIKWLAPESINFRKFSSSSDVWMFAVCMWEILTYGEKPFQNIKNYDVIRLIENNERLPHPENCPQELFSVMMRCWEYDPALRPNFNQLQEILHSIYMNYKERTVLIASYTPPSYSSPLPSELDQLWRPTTLFSPPVNKQEAPPKPKRNQNAKVPTTIKLNTPDRLNGSRELQEDSDNQWLNERLKNLGVSFETQSKNDFLLKDFTFDFIKKISNFVQSLSKDNNFEIDHDLGLILKAWSLLKDAYEDYPLKLSKINEFINLVKQCDENLSCMIDELRTNTFDRVINLALDLARKANELFSLFVRLNAD